MSRDSFEPVAPGPVYPPTDLRVREDEAHYSRGEAWGIDVENPNEFYSSIRRDANGMCD